MIKYLILVCILIINNQVHGRNHKNGDSKVLSKHLLPYKNSITRDDKPGSNLNKNEYNSGVNKLTQKDIEFANPEGLPVEPKRYPALPEGYPPQGEQHQYWPQPEYKPEPKPEPVYPVYKPEPEFPYPEGLVPYPETLATTTTTTSTTPPPPSSGPPTTVPPTTAPPTTAPPTSAAPFTQGPLGKNGLKQQSLNRRKPKTFYENILENLFDNQDTSHSSDLVNNDQLVSSTTNDDVQFDDDDEKLLSLIYRR